MAYLASQRVSSRLLILMLLFMLSLISTSGQGAAGQDGNPPGVATAKLGPKEEQVRFTSGSTTLAGTLFWPAERSGCTAVVLLAGSDRSERGGLRMKIASQYSLRFSCPK